jgi:hypothetical protein
MKHRQPAYWPTRILLAVGFIATVIAVALSLYLMTNGPMIDPQPDILGLPADVVGRLAGLVPVLVGFTWMLRIFRGPRDEPPTWRYRHR